MIEVCKHLELSNSFAHLHSHNSRSLRLFLVDDVLVGHLRLSSHLSSRHTPLLLKSTRRFGLTCSFERSENLSYSQEPQSRFELRPPFLLRRI
jgi:hypothetical protein